MKKIVVIIMTLIVTLSFFGCLKKQDKVSEEKIENWQQVQEKSKNTTVNLYGYGGDENVNKWIDEVLAKKVKDDYDITLNRVPMDIDSILNKLLGEKQANNNEGTIDLVWINGENFYSAKKANLLYGPFTNIMPNFKKYVNDDLDDIKKDFGYEVDGYESPFGRAQLVMVYNKNKVTQNPRNTKELMEFCKNNPGKFTYPAPPDFTGSAFIRNVIYDVVGEDTIKKLKNKEDIEKAIEPAINYLNELKPYLWNEGKTYPATLAQLDNMFVDNEVFATITYSPNSIDGRIKKGEYPKDASSDIFDNGTIGNTHFVAVPYNAKNKEGAIAVANVILSVDMQASKYNPLSWGDLPAIDNSKLSDEEKSSFNEAKISDSIVKQEKLLNHRYSEVDADIIPIIEEIWMEKVAKEE